MKTIAIKKFGSADELIEMEMDSPTIHEDQVLIEVYAFSINPVDWKRRAGHMGGKLPMILGGDVAGVVAKAGKDVTHLKVGDRVFANASRTYSEYVKARASVTVKIPDNLSFAEAAAVPLAGQTAWEALIEQGHLKKGDKVLVHAGAGGVGSLAIQIAKHFGAAVASTASEQNKNFLTSLGVDHFIDYKKEDFEQTLDDMDLVLDPIGGETQEKSLHVLKKGGRLVSLVQEPDNGILKELGVTGAVFSMSPTGERLHQIAELLKNEDIKPLVTQIYSFTEDGVRKAHEQSESGHTRGKIVIEVKIPRSKD